MYSGSGAAGGRVAVGPVSIGGGDGDVEGEHLSSDAERIDGALLHVCMHVCMYACMHVL